MKPATNHVDEIFAFEFWIYNLLWVNYKCVWYIVKMIEQSFIGTLINIVIYNKCYPFVVLFSMWGKLTNMTFLIIFLRYMNAFQIYFLLERRAVTNLSHQLQIFNPLKITLNQEKSWNLKLLNFSYFHLNDIFT